MVNSSAPQATARQAAKTRREGSRRISRSCRSCSAKTKAARALSGSFPPRWSVEELDFLERAQSEPICYNLIGSGPHPFEWEVSTMSHAKQTSKRRSRAKALTLGVAGALSLAGGASVAAVGTAGDTLTANTAITFDEEEIFDASLSTFYVFDHENAGARRPGLQLAQRTRRRPTQGSSGGVDDCASGGPTCCATCGSPGACG